MWVLADISHITHQESFDKIHRVLVEALVKGIFELLYLLENQVLGLALERRYPDLYIPRYSLVSFHRVPYAEAKRQGKIQTEILEELCTSISSVNEVDWNTADRLIKERLGNH